VEVSVLIIVTEVEVTVDGLTGSEKVMIGDIDVRTLVAPLVGVEPVIVGGVGLGGVVVLDV
jgi:hypothetical protein